MNDIAKGQKVFIVDGLAAGSERFIIVRESEIENIIDDRSFTTQDKQLYTFGRSAYYMEAEANEQALRMEAARFVIGGGSRPRHLLEWERLVENCSRGMPGGYWQTANFTDWEFECQHCRQKNMDRWLVLRLQLSRSIANIPYRLNSAWRCSVWNKEVGGTHDSSHCKGLAVDIAAETSEQRFVIVGACIEAGFKRIGIGNDFIHVDTDTDKAQGVIWKY